MIDFFNSKSVFENQRLMQNHQSSSCLLLSSFGSHQKVFGGAGQSPFLEVMVSVPDGESLDYKFFFNSIQSRIDLKVKLGTGSTFKLTSVAYLQNHDALDFSVEVEHFGPKSVSEVLHTCLLLDHSKSGFFGAVHVPKNIEFCEAHQKNENFLLSDFVQVKTSPNLMISNQEVKCSHGSTVSGISEEELFYLQSRGLNFEEAKKVWVMGKLSSVWSEEIGELLGLDFE